MSDSRTSLPAVPTTTLLDTLRRELVQAGVARLQLDTLRLRLVKIGGRLSGTSQSAKAI